MRWPLVVCVVGLLGCFGDVRPDTPDGAADSTPADLAADTGAPKDAGPPDAAPDTPGMDAADAADTPKTPPGDSTPGDAPPDAPRGCVTDGDCRDPLMPVCDAPRGRCVQCTAASDRCPPTHHCDADNGICVPGCRSDEGCPRGAVGDSGVTLTGRCDTARHLCVECATDDDCPVRTVCSDGICAPGCNERRGCAVGETCCAGVCVETATDLDHCGACGRRCRPAEATARCAAGACAITACNEGRADCNGALDDGCEADLRADPARCGRCDNRCPSLPSTATTACTLGRCGFTCRADTADCDGMASNGCEADLSGDPARCGRCDNRCPAAANASPRCAGGLCGYACAEGFGDCDGERGTGCETDLRATTAHCGACAARCPTPPNATPVCTRGACGYMCAAGFGDCDGEASNGCEAELATAVEHCARCGNRCVIAGGAAACVAGACQVASCGASFADCDAVAGNGCETDTRGAVDHCGRCGNVCPARPNAPGVCAGGACTTRCAGGFGDCDGDGSNGCETDLRTSVAHCGTCGNPCAAPRGAPGCAAGVCTVVGCDAGYGDCDRDARNGCETDLRTSPAHCGACGARPPEQCDGADNTCNGAADEGCPTGLGGLSELEFTSPTYGSGGAVTTATCPAGMVVRGFSGRVNSYLTQLTPSCGTPRLVEDRSPAVYRYSVTVDGATNAGSVGIALGTAWSYTCPGHSVVGRVLGTSSGSYVTSFRFECVDMTVTGSPASGFRVGRSVVALSPTFGGTAGAAFSWQCPEDSSGFSSFLRSVSGGYLGFRIFYLTSFTARCTSPTLSRR